MYSVVLMMALTTGGDATMGRHHGGCCGEVASCGCEGGRHHGHRHHGGCCGEVASCGCCGQVASCGCCGQVSSCSSCGGCGASTGCSSCANGACAFVQTEAGAAVIVVSLPADAKLTVDGEATTSTSDQRVFVSPALPTGQDYHYTLQAEVVVDGKSVTVSKTVSVRAGEESHVTLTPVTGVASR